MQKPPHDSVLKELLTSGGFETLVRIAGLGRGEDDLSGLVSTRFPGLAPASRAWLATAIGAALQAGEDFLSMPEDYRLSIGSMPRIPAYGIPGVSKGDIVALGQVVQPGGGPRGVDLGYDFASVFGISMTKAMVQEDIADKLSDDAKRYERYEQWLNEQLETRTTIVFGVFIVD